VTYRSVLPSARILFIARWRGLPQPHPCLDSLREKTLRRLPQLVPIQCSVDLPRHISRHRSPIIVRASPAPCYRPTPTKFSIVAGRDLHRKFCRFNGVTRPGGARGVSGWDSTIDRTSSPLGKAYSLFAEKVSPREGPDVRSEGGRRDGDPRRTVDDETLDPAMAMSTSPSFGETFERQRHPCAMTSPRRHEPRRFCPAR
jgi:hypothetical protein